MTEYRIVVVGAGGVGKSALTVRFTGGNFVEKVPSPISVAVLLMRGKYDPTIEDSYRKAVEVDGTACMLDIMDTAGQEEYRALRDQYMKTGNVCGVCITSQTSFEAASKLRGEILKIKEDYPDIPIMLVGNKCDMVEERVVQTADGRALATKFGTGFIESSAKTNTNVSELFYELVRMINKWREKHNQKSNLQKKGPGEKKGLCMLL